MPWLGASPSLTLRGITVSKTRSLKNSRMSRATCWPRFVERGAHAAQRRDQVRQPLEREVLAVERNQHRVGGDEGIQREETQRWRRVDEDEVELIAQRLEEIAEPALAREHRDELDLGTREVPVRRNEPQVLHGSLEHERRGVLDRVLRRERLIDRPRGGGLPFQPEPTGEIALWIHVDDEDALLRDRQGR